MVNKLIRAMLGNAVLANVLMLLIFLCGFLATISMVREIFPRFSLDVITVSVAYPGADPREVEEGICERLEEALDGVEGIKKLKTTAAENVGTAIVECVEGADVREVKDEVKTLVDAITTFPDDAERPVVTEVKFRGEVMGVAVWGDLPEHQLKEFAREIEDELLARGCVTQSDVSGVRDYEIAIEISDEKLQRYNLSFQKIQTAVAKSGLNLPSGMIRTADEEYRIRAVGRRYRAKDYRDIPVVARPDGAIIRLGQIADVRDTFDEDAKVRSQFNGKPAVSINLFKTEEEDALVIADAVDEYLRNKVDELPEGVHLTKYRDISRMIVDRLNILVENGAIGLACVFLALWIFLDFRLSFWVGMGIPISVAGGLALMGAAGGSLNMLSMFGLIMVLGLIVDDAIVVGESIYARRQEGIDAETATVEGAAAVALPVLAAVLTTIMAFVPLFYVKGVMGKFIRQIPIPVVASLAVSLVEALFILPVHLRHLPDPGLKPRFFPARLSGFLRGGVTRGLGFFIQRVYGPALDVLLVYRYPVLGAGLALIMLIVGLFKGEVIKYVMFPEADDDFIRAKVELAPGTPIARTSEVGEALLASWREVEREFVPESGAALTKAAFTIIGDSIDRRERGGQTNQLETTIELLPSEERNIHYLTLARAWQRNVGRIPGAVATSFSAFRHGPGGNPLEIKLLGNDQESLLTAADELKSKIESLEGTYDTQTDYRPGKREFIVTIKPEAHHLGLTLDDLARHVRGGFYGAEALRIQRGRDDVKVKVRYPENEGRNSVEYFKRLWVETPAGDDVPFLSVADVDLRQGPSVINRRNRKRMVTVFSDVDRDKANAEQILRQLKAPFLPKLAARHGVSYLIEGQAQETRESFSSLLIWFPIAMCAVYFIIASLFRSYLQPLVIMTTIPFGLVGAVIGHMLFGLPVTMMSAFGMVALAGIVVNDAIVLIEGVNVRLGEGMPLFTALREGGKRRFRAILLTTITTFAGLTPLIMEKSMQAQFLIPMAVAIAFGVLFATVVTLVLIPCVVAILNDARRGVHFVFNGTIPSREEMEPRSSSN